MIEKDIYGNVMVNDHLFIEHDVLYCGAGPFITLTDFNEPIEGGVDDFHSITISTKQEAEQVRDACQSFLDSIDDWDWVAKDKPDDNTE